MNKRLIHGIHAIDTAVRNDPDNIQIIWADGGRKNARLQQLLKKIKAAKLPLQFVSTAELTAQVKTDKHQGIVAEYRDAKTYRADYLFDLLDKLQEPAFLLILDGVTDPHNLGACLRTAECAGVHAVIVPKDKAATLTPTARKVASGAAEIIPFITVTNLKRTLQDLKKAGVWLIGTSDKATQSIYKTSLQGSIAIIMGAEGKGLRRLTEEACDFICSIPMAGDVSSLNISVATGVCLFEAVRQRGGEE